MKRCDYCGEVNWSPYRLDRKQNPICTQCGKSLPKGGSAHPILGHHPVGEHGVMDGYVREKLKGDE